MRQRNVKNKEFIINNSRYIILSPCEYINSWHSVFNNNNPIYIEVGMGKGDFIIENAKRYPDINFIGIEKYDSIIAIALKKIDKEDLPNLRVIRMNANIIDSVFNHEIQKIFLNFSDPWPKKRHEDRRLTSREYLDKYAKIIENSDNVSIEMKTDNQQLFEYSLVSFNNNGYLITEISLDLENSEKEDNIKTEYEKKFMDKGNKIYYVKVMKN